MTYEEEAGVGRSGRARAKEEEGEIGRGHIDPAEIRRCRDSYGRCSKREIGRAHV